MKEKMKNSTDIKTEPTVRRTLTEDEIKEMKERAEKFKRDACYGCKALPGEPHKPGCDIEVCSVCGGQRLQEHFMGNLCKDHDPGFARWTGFWPGSLEADALDIDMNTFYALGLNKILLVKPKVKNGKNQK